MKPESLITFLIFLVVLALVAYIQGCAPHGYISGQTACEIDNENLKEEIRMLRERESSKEVDEPEEELYYDEE